MIALTDRLAAAARRAPAAVAIVHGSRRVTYGEVLDEVRAMAGLLVRLGVRRGDRVGVLAENSPEYVVAWYGALAAGAVAVGLNSASRAGELATRLRHAGACGLVAAASHQELPALLREAATPWTIRMGSAGAPMPGVADGLVGEIVDWTEARVAAAGPAVDLHSAAPSDLAALVYTSGTTAAPKAVTLSHGNLSANVEAILEYLQLTASDRTLCVLPFYYSYGASVLHTHLAAGATLVLENSMAWPVRVLERMEAERVTGFSGVPSTYALLLKRAQLDRFELSSLRYLTQAGGPMPAAHVVLLRAALPRARLFLMYGQTEATARLSYLPPERLDDKPGSVGIPVPGIEIEVRDDSGRTLEPGERGEVCARGGSIMVGYWRDSDATAVAIRDGWLHTGDIGHRDRDGFLFLSGRRSDMIKSGAHRINPLEIEEVVARIDGVVESAAVGIADEVLGEVVKLVVVPRPGVSLDVMTVQRWCREHLASYMVPRVVELAAELPKSPSGKVQRHRLQT